MCESPTIASTSGTFLRIAALRLALHLQRVGDVLGGGAARQQLEVLEDAADVAAQHRHLRALQPAELAAADDDLALASARAP